MNGIINLAHHQQALTEALLCTGRPRLGTQETCRSTEGWVFKTPDSWRQAFYQKRKGTPNSGYYSMNVLPSACRHSTQWNISAGQEPLFAERAAGTLVRKLMNNVIRGSGSIIRRRQAEPTAARATHELARMGRTENSRASKYKIAFQIGIQARRETDDETDGEVRRA